MPPQPIWTRFLPDAIVIPAATLGALGRLPAPGTWGSFAGLMWFTVVCVPAGWLGSGIITAIGVYLAFALCGEAEMRMRRTDPPEIILDEFACMPIGLLGFHDIIATPEAWVVFVLGFLLFRFFDILKPLGISRLQRFPGGTGVVLDDLAAALATCAILQLVLRFSPLLAWLRAHGPLTSG
jgi:phosphatidylglycerophosphatase A